MSAVPPPGGWEKKKGEEIGDRADAKGGQEAAAQAAASKAVRFLKIVGGPPGSNPTAAQRMYEALSLVVRTQAAEMPKPETLNFGQLVRALKDWNQWAAAHQTQTQKKETHSSKASHEKIRNAYMSRIQVLYNEIAPQLREPRRVDPPATLQQASELLDLIEVRNAKGTTALLRAVNSIQPDFPMALRLIEWGADPNAADESEATPLIYAAGLGHETAIERLLQAGAKPNLADNRGQTALQFAANRGDGSIVKRLLDAGADPNAMDRSGNTPLHLAIERGDDRIVGLLIAAKVDVNHVNPRGWTPLAWAASKGQISIMKQLLEAGANLHYRHPSTGNRPIDSAQGVEAITLLRRAMMATPDPNDVKYENSELHRAAAVGDIEAVKRLIADRVDLNRRNALGETPLHLAAWASTLGKDALEALLIAGADPNIATTQPRGPVPAGTTPLMYAVVAGPAVGSALVTQLLAAKANPNAVSEKGRSALHQAAKRGYTDIVQQLLAAGADPKLVDEDGHTAFSYAENNGHRQTAALLLIS
jgi:uncharacterized protein